MNGKSLLNSVLRSLILGLIVAIILLLVVPDLRKGSGFSNGFFNEPSASESRQSYYDALSRAAPAVVNIYSVSTERDTFRFRTQQRERTSLGSGVIMTENGYILTCLHVVADADHIYVRLQDNRTLSAQLVGADQYTDLAVLKVTAPGLHVIPQVEDTDIRVGDVVMAIGNPYDLGQTVTQGIVSHSGRRTGLDNTNTGYIQTDAVLNQGNSGGALVDSNGVLLGIANAKFLVRDARRRVVSVDGINFAVPYELAKEVMEEIINNGRVVRGYLGFEGGELLGHPGVILVNVVAPNSPAAKAGLQPGDAILSIDGVQLESASKALDLISQSEPGSVLELEVSRDGSSFVTPVTIGER